MDNARPLEASVVLMFDPTTKRVGCVLLQAAYGFGAGNWLVYKFNSEAWITGEGVEKLKPFKATVAEWKKAAEICNKAHPEAAWRRTIAP